MDRLTLTKRDRRLHPEAFARDTWVREQAARLPTGARVLDAGAGASKYRPLFSHCDYLTQDFCQYEGELVKYVAPIDVVSEITSIPLPTQSLDAILCTEVFEHVPDPAAVLAEFARLLKSGGVLLLTAPQLSAPHMEPYHFYGGFTRHWYQHWLPTKGFHIETVTPVGGPALTAMVYMQIFHQALVEAETHSSGINRWWRKLSRIPVRLLARGVLPRILPPLDKHLDSSIVCSGFMVRAIRE